MPSFERRFLEARGKPIEYGGNTLILVDDFPTLGETRLRLVFETCNGEWRQGVSLRVRQKGSLTVNGQRLKHTVCWHDTAPQTVDFEVVGNVSAIEVKNVWDVGNGVMDSWHNGAAMIVEDLANGRRYRCNDGFPDEDFDDIVFRLERAE